MADWKKKAQERVKEKSAGSSVKLEQGVNCLRVCPDKKDLLPDGRVGPKGLQHPPFREFRIHRDVGPDKAMLACGIDIEGKGKCWLCQVKIPELESSGIPQKQANAQKIGPQEQFLVNASRFDGDTNKFTTIKPWWVSTGSGIPGRQGQSLAVRVYSKIASSKRDFVDPNKGYNLNVERQGEGLKTRYPAVESDEAPSKLPAALLAAMKDLDGSIPVYDEEDQKSAYFGRPRRDANSEQEEAPRRGASGGARRPAPEPAPEPEEEYEEGAAEEEYEEGAPEGEEAEAEYEEPQDEEAPPEEELVEEELSEEEPPPDDEEAPAEEYSEEEGEPEAEEPEAEEPEPPPPPRRTAPPTKKAAPPAPARKAAPAPPPARKAAPAPVKKTVASPANKKAAPPTRRK